MSAAGAGSPLRVLTVFGGLGRGATSGAERMAWRTTAHLARRGVEVAVLTDAAPPSDLADVPWPVHVSPAALADDPAGTAMDVVHIYDLAMPGYAALGRDIARRLGARLVITPASAPQTWPDPALGARLCAEADAVFTLTATEDEAIRSLNAGPIRTLRLPQAPDLVGRPDPRRFRQRHGLHGRIVLFLGRKIASKGYRTLVEATSVVWARVPEAEFVFCGPACEPGAAQAVAAMTDDRIRDLGMLDDRAKHDALAACDVVALPSSADVFPLVFVEAWACGKPVLAGRFRGVDDVVRHGVDGIVVEPSASAVGEALIGLLTDDRARTALGRAGRARVRRHLTWDRVAATVEAGYR